mmetsp:Transcript_82323/g.266822  ORF Transcript_82323/g.266822 Transcript_82323/m.266822 type:complete len:317 (+) Transcript_82323:251-1201(+)
MWRLRWLRHPYPLLELVEQGLQQHLPPRRVTDKVRWPRGQCLPLAHHDQRDRRLSFAAFRGPRGGCGQRLGHAPGPCTYLLPLQYRPCRPDERGVLVHHAPRTQCSGRMRLPRLRHRPGDHARDEEGPADRGALPGRLRGGVPGPAGGAGAAPLAEVAAQLGTPGQQGEVLELAGPGGPVHPGDDQGARPRLQRVPSHADLFRLLQHGWLGNSAPQRVPHEELHGGHLALRQLPRRRRLHGRRLRPDRRRLLRRQRRRPAPRGPAEDVGCRRDCLACGPPLCARQHHVGGGAEARAGAGPRRPLGGQACGCTPGRP